MRRDLTGLESQEFDLIVVGGGIYGACVAWDAARRVLSVAVLEKGDFVSATSANSLKTIHGGFRYLQNLDFPRMRESIRERRALSIIAPHLVHPLPVLIPTYGHGIMGREAMRLALLANDLIGFDRNRLDDPQKRIPNGRTISPRECLDLLPGLPERGLTGGAFFYDAQVYNSERLVLAFIRSAEKAGACVANYAEVTGFLSRNGRVTGVQVLDVPGGGRFEVRGRMVVNTTGPWVDWIRSKLDSGGQVGPKIRLAKALNIITRPLFGSFAVGIPGDNGYQEGDAVGRKKSSFLFVAPWRDRSIIGTIYAHYSGSPDDFKACEGDGIAVLNAYNRAYPAMPLGREDVTFLHAGLLPATSGTPEVGDVNLMKHCRIHDHHDEGVQGLLSVVGVKFTTARGVAEKVVDRVFTLWGQKAPASPHLTPLVGGDIPRFDDFLQKSISRRPYGLQEGEVRSLVYNHGSAYTEVLACLPASMGGERTLNDRQAALTAQVVYAVQNEMAMKLGDVIFRRTELGTAGHPGEEILEFCAGIMGKLFGWNESRVRQEIDEVGKVYQPGG
jgi:glycerol-3-phosphate dehydrogenase